LRIKQPGTAIYAVAKANLEIDEEELKRSSERLEWEK